jgi:hypothetical protein
MRESALHCRICSASNAFCSITAHKWLGLWAMLILRSPQAEKIFLVANVMIDCSLRHRELAQCCLEGNKTSTLDLRYTLPLHYGSQE